MSNISTSRKGLTLFDSALMVPAIIESFKKLNPRTQLRSPVLFVVLIVSHSHVCFILFDDGVRQQQQRN